MPICPPKFSLSNKLISSFSSLSTQHVCMLHSCRTSNESLAYVVFYNTITSQFHVVLCTTASFAHMLLFFQECHTMSVAPGPLMSAHVLSLPTVMTTDHLSLQGFAHGLYRVTGSIWDSLMRKCFVLSYTQRH